MNHGVVGSAVRTEDHQNANTMTHSGAVPGHCDASLSSSVAEADGGLQERMAPHSQL